MARANPARAAGAVACVGGAGTSTELRSFTPRKMELGCSTGDFSFADVRVEQLRR